MELNVLVKKAKKGDGEAFVNIVKQYEGVLYKVARRFLNNNEDVADAMQDTVMSAYKSINTLHDERYFNTWICKILINKCNGILNKNKIKNGDGQYVFDSDGKNTYMTNDSVSQPVLDSNNEIQYDMLLESLKGNIPELKDAVVEVAGIAYADTNYEMKTIEGAWDLALDNDSRQKDVEVEYAAQNSTQNMEIISAKMSPTAFNIRFVLNMTYDVKHMPILNGLKLIEADGKGYIAKGYTWDDKDGKVEVSASFPVSSYTDASKYTLHISDIGENGSNGKLVSLMPGGDIVLEKK